jgi:hypothetical protein
LRAWPNWSERWKQERIAEGNSENEFQQTKELATSSRPATMSTLRKRLEKLKKLIPPIVDPDAEWGELAAGRCEGHNECTNAPNPPA